MRRILSCGIFTILFSLTASAVLPPLSEAARVATASDIVEGRVKFIASFEHQKGENFSDTVYYVGLMVTGVPKGSIKPGEIISFSYWKQKERPSGWCGPSGQYSNVENETNIRAYLTKGVTGYKVIEPNGLDTL